MPGVVVKGALEDGFVNENGNSTPRKENSVQNKPPNCTPSLQSSQNAAVVETPFNGVVDTSIEQLYDNVCEMQSSDQSPSKPSFGSDDDESRIDSELCHLVGGEMREVEIMEEEVVEVEKNRDHDHESHSDSGSKKEARPWIRNPGNWIITNQRKLLNSESESSLKSNPKSKSPQEKPHIDVLYIN
ncbi:Protein KINESIN LIGHT CHAIN-RELATED 3 [Camellia lanceoleosa]|uniref:Protein KINESIN LIGHT CHAIN-RELATED 3 n=1 Tax=Camellia lanceoleosa TaxID=1840588 RepID=A0ACC0J695_9ERIC|nr:Protein KINESIN LIGHT CHAIN-RELATED 3 [Camellia lanceoleosa]